MKILSLSILSLAFICHSAFSKEMKVEREALGNLSVQTQVIEAISTYTGKEIMAQVAVLPGQSYVFKSPINVQQVQYLKGLGDTVAKNEAFAIIQGPEVHHFHHVFETQKVLFEQAQTLFNNSAKLYQRKSLSEQAWLDISNQFHDTKMKFDELTHFFDLVLSFDETQESLTLASPVAGVLQYSIGGSLDANNVIASFLPKQAIRLKLNLPIGASHTPTSVKLGNCHLDIDFIESANSAFYKVAWSKALTADCAFAVGQVLIATPEYKTNAYQVKQSAVFNLNGDNYIFIQNKQNYEAVKVTLVTSQENTYIVQSAELIDKQKVLVSSVSAVQGILLGLGI